MTNVLVSEFINILSQQGFDGDCYLDEATRLVHATDNSVYQLLPAAVIAPSHASDIQLVLSLLKEQRFGKLTLTARGGGTGTNGQALNHSIILDCSKYLNQIVEINLENMFARVQPGVVLDQLNEQLQAHGVFFAPTVSPSNRATLGGMTNTDACGKGSRLYGKTSQHVLSISAVYSDGSEHTSQAISIDQLDEHKRLPGQVGAAYQQVSDTACQYRTQIEQQFPKLSRYMTGYDLAHIYDHSRQRFNLNSVICGSEGSLTIITELKLKLTPLPKFKRLAVLQYSDFNHALSHAKRLLTLEPASIETLDGTLLQLAKSDIIYPSIKPYIENQDIPTDGINLIEWVGESLDHLSQIEHALKTLCNEPGSPNTSITIADSHDTAALWTLRKKSVGLLGKTKGPRKPLSGVEDTVVPPEKLADFIKDFRALLDHHGLQYGMFGHVDAGCLHVRPAYDLCDDNDKHLYFGITEQVAQLVQSYGGLLWGEHGKGIRSHYVKQFFGDELYQECRKIKQAFDPNNQLNPGKIATPANSTDQLMDIHSPLRADHDKLIRSNDQIDFEPSLSCNGNAACFDYNTLNALCPSYKVSRDKRYSPKGRTSLVREWLARQAKGTLNKHFEHQVYDSFDHCLGCKACSTGCPININIPNEKSKFLHRYYQKHRHSLQTRLLIKSERIAIKQAKHPWFFQWLTRSKLFQLGTKIAAQLRDLPTIAAPNLSLYCTDKCIEPLSVNDLIKRKKQTNDVVILQDALTSCYEPKLVIAIIQLLQKLGINPILLQLFENGKMLHVLGRRKQFETIAKHNAENLTKLSQANYPMIGIDPSITLSYSDEYLSTLDSLNFQVHLIQDWLQMKKFNDTTISQTKPITLLLHCTEATNNPSHGLSWTVLFERFGLKLKIAQVGCCGMAGSYGLQQRHYADSKKLFDLSWQQHMHNDHIILATGFSCRCQTRRFSEREVLHPLQWLDQQLSHLS